MVTYLCFTKELSGISAEEDTNPVGSGLQPSDLI